MTLDLFSAPDPDLPANEGPAPDREAWSVSRLNEAVASLLARGLPPVWVEGELANLTQARSGHLYFSLRDDESQLRCVMWRDRVGRLPSLPEEGMTVRVFGRVGLYQRRGEYQLTADRMEAAGEGLWKLAFERVRARLEADGLLDPARKRPLPPFPARVGVVTSGDGAALRDILQVVRRRAPWTEILVSGCRVQGEGAAEEIECALERLYRLRAVDVVIVARGGGSIEDLWAFNEERVARAICRSPVPVVSAVGHETDVTIADLVADLRAPTPSAGAECAVPSVQELARDLGRTAGRIDEAVRRDLEARSEGLRRGADTLHRAVDRAISDGDRRLAAKAARLHALSPLAILGRGYAVPRAADGSVPRTAAAFRRGMRFRLRLSDGEVGCEVVEEMDE